jgi:hypothetical protein
MAKISFYGSWIDVKSLNKKDKKNYVTSMVFTILGAFAWGMHLAGNETGFLSVNNEGGSNTGGTIYFCETGCGGLLDNCDNFLY